MKNEDKVVKALRTKVYTNKVLSPVEEKLIYKLYINLIEENKKEFKLRSFDIILQNILREEYSNKKYFKIIAYLKRTYKDNSGVIKELEDQKRAIENKIKKAKANNNRNPFDWVPTAVAEACIDTVFSNNDVNSENIVLYKSNNKTISFNTCSSILSLKEKDIICYSIEVDVNELPLFKNMVEMVK